MSKPERGYQVFTAVDEYGFANTGLSAVINDRDTSVTVPWQVSQTGNLPKNIEWAIKSDNGVTYTVTVPVLITYNSTTGKSTATYSKGTYRITAPQTGGT